MIILPILFCMVHVLASGVFFSGFLKDLLCIPRPLSPPLQRITLSSTTSLEYGFPSTHSTNAASVAVYALFFLNSPGTGIDYRFSIALQCLSCAYVLSIVLGRLYCGMHGFFDVTIGTALGALISVIQCVYGTYLDDYIHNGSYQALLIVVLIILVLVRIHPEPADDCPCFDDSVAFAGVMIGVEVGCSHYARSGLAWDHPVPATAPFRLEEVGMFKATLRIVAGVFVVFAWRALMKPTLLKVLPPVFRVIEKLGLNLPRRFFKQASEYKEVPNDLKDDSVIPYVSEIPSLLTSIRHPRRSRSVSVGPQSQADAYETLAYREKRRRESTSEMASANPVVAEEPSSNGRPSGYFDVKAHNGDPARIPMSAQILTQATSNIDLYQQMMEADIAVASPLTPASETSLIAPMSRQPSEDRRQYEKDEKELFSQLQKPRVRYDVEVITKLIVYTGIAWISVEGNPILFDYLGLGMNNPGG
ncbi:MAG: hypothetical protein Q9191_007584 [Dirinaria sp. TL-2023a]